VTPRATLLFAFAVKQLVVANASLAKSYSLSPYTYITLATSLRPLRRISIRLVLLLDTFRLWVNLGPVLRCGGRLLVKQQSLVVRPTVLLAKTSKYCTEVVLNTEPSTLTLEGRTCNCSGRTAIVCFLAPPINIGLSDEV